MNAESNQTKRDGNHTNNDVLIRQFVKNTTIATTTTNSSVEIKIHERNIQGILTYKKKFNFQYGIDILRFFKCKICICSLIRFKYKSVRLVKRIN